MPNSIRAFYRTSAILHSFIYLCRIFFCFFFFFFSLLLVCVVLLDAFNTIHSFYTKNEYLFNKEIIYLCTVLTERVFTFIFRMFVGDSMLVCLRAFHISARSCIVYMSCVLYFCFIASDSFTLS